MIHEKSEYVAKVLNDLVLKKMNNEAEPDEKVLRDSAEEIEELSGLELPKYSAACEISGAIFRAEDTTFEDTVELRNQIQLRMFPAFFKNPASPK